MKLGIFGRPLGHTRSPRLFARLAKVLKRPISYEAVEVGAGEFPAATAWARAKGWRGANVTIPFKLEAAAWSDRLTPAADALGAVNALRFEGKKIVGHNTDADGLSDAIRRAGFRIRGKDVLLFGAGGAARAAAWALGKNGARKVRVANRTAATAKKLVRDLAPFFPRTKFSCGKPANAGVWINATPLGQKGNPDRSPAPASLRPPDAAMDLVYGRKTAFQRHAERLGARVTDGTAMLVFQALRAYEFWEKPLGAARRALLAETLIKELS